MPTAKIEAVNRADMIEVSVLCEDAKAVESHTASELAEAPDASVRIRGGNSRDLSLFHLFDRERPLTKHAVTFDQSGHIAT